MCLKSTHIYSRLISFMLNYAVYITCSYFVLRPFSFSVKINDVRKAIF
nr:MAG TPA: hypothetical protein [Caudoviricetes sp.]